MTCTSPPRLASAHRRAAAISLSRAGASPPAIVCRLILSAVGLCRPTSHLALLSSNATNSVAGSVSVTGAAGAGEVSMRRPPVGSERALGPYPARTPAAPWDLDDGHQRLLAHL